jgi:hypothetical protein
VYNTTDVQSRLLLRVFSLREIGHNAIDQYLNAVCITRTLAHLRWLLCDFNDRREEVNLADGPNFF